MTKFVELCLTFVLVCWPHHTFVTAQCNCGTDCATSCVAGQYFDSGASACAVCPQGKYCTGAGAVATDCPAGTYSAATGNTASSDCTACPSGKYQEQTGQTSCDDCPAGKSCTASVASNCAAGTYSTGGQTTCTDCPIGSSCPSASTAHTVCSDGYYTSSTGQTSCSQCPAGNECPNHGAPVQCVAGLYSTLGSGKCLPCEEGTYSSSAGSISCTQCTEGHFCGNATSTPTPCATGYVAPTGSSTCTLCSSDKVADSNQALCESCPAGKACTNPASTPADCASGTYSLLGDASCTNCPAGSKCSVNNVAPVACSSGEYSVAGQTACTACPGGHSCADATSTPVLCASGEYSPSGTMTCITCTAGNYCPQGADVETSCAVTGFYSAAGASSCTQCPAGSSCTTTAATACSAGSYSLLGEETCTTCPAGNECTNQGISPVACTSGTYNLAGSSTACVQCPGGSYCQSTTVSPSLCASGYNSNPGSISCTQCPAGYACPDLADLTKNFLCGAGQYSAAGEMTCTDCAAGSYCPSTESAIVIECPSGYYSLANATSCIGCPAGSKCPNKNGVGIEVCNAGTYATGNSVACTDCPPGFYCPLTTSDQSIECSPGTYSVGIQTSCTECPTGTECPFTDQSTQILCALGTFSVGNQTSCTQCAIGYECPDPFTNSSTPCAAGYYSNGGQEQCTMCQEGQYCEFTTQGGLDCAEGLVSTDASTNCTACTAGYYCPTTRYSQMTECPEGYYSIAGQIKCSKCDPGYQCPMASTTPAPPDGLCNKGGYCPDGKLFVACNPGKYNAFNGSTVETQCSPCPAGYYCDQQGLEDYSLYLCPVGAYCPSGTVDPTNCPGGTYNDQGNATRLSDCKVCPAGYYCPDGTGDQGTICPKGFYCLAGQTDPTVKPCPVGTYGPAEGFSNETQCTECPAGHFCPAGSGVAPTEAPTKCSAGKYNPDTGSGLELNCKLCDSGRACPWEGQINSTHDCQEGYFCPVGTSTPDQFPCFPGTFTNRTDLTSAEDCELCPQGYYCEWATTGMGTVDGPQNCRRGFYCPQGSPNPEQFPCPAGTYSDAANLYQASQCTPCPAGYYCTGGQNMTTGICPIGYYCPESTINGEQYGCPNGTYNNLVGAMGLSNCTNCTQGHYCEFRTTVPEKCQPGTYMPWGTDGSGNMIGPESAKRQFDCLDCPGGSYCGEGTITPHDCGTGLYSKVGQFECKTCIMGHYCDNVTTSESDMLNDKVCHQGHLCGEGLTSMSLAADCIPGTYCPAGTLEMINCPVGTIQNETAQWDVTLHCLPCPAGSYCLAASASITGLCDMGYYCPSPVDTVYLTLPAKIGAYGPQQIPCPQGTYADVTGTPDEASCKPCPAGYYCPLASTATLNCLQGYYCPANSSAPTSCPIGRYGNASNLMAMDDCNLCDPGFYCDAPGLLSPRDQCDPGFVCYSGASTSGPTDGVTGDRCPAGGYCLKGSFEAKPCPMGTYSNVSGSVDKYDCTDCDPGYYCSQLSGGAPTGPCNAGCYCTGAATNACQFATEAGYFSPAASSLVTECLVGTYNPLPQQGACLTCPAGSYCQDKAMNYSIICPSGQYCPEGSQIPSDCPPGTFLSQQGMISLDNCTNCPAGFYCQDRGASNYTAECKAGHICYGSAESRDPVYNNDPTGNKTLILYGDSCSPGYYCPQGTAVMIECPVGTYNPDRSGQSVANCLPCDPGRYCNNTALTETTGLCSAGYYCKGGAWLPSPVDNTTGDICPQFNYCPAGADLPKICDIGYYANTTGMSACQLCLAGYICYPGEAPTICPQGKYCPASTLSDPLDNPDACPIGTYSTDVGLSLSTECLDCKPGYYCDEIALVNVTKKIAAGWWSVSGATVAQPDDYLELRGKCPKGFYCMEGTSSPLPCAPGSYGPSFWLKSEAECTACDGGYYCTGSNMTTTGNPCTAGYYCSSGSPEAAPVNQTWGDICPTGYYCPAGTQDPIPCDAGKYANATGSTSCLTCPAGYYCTVNTSDPIPCPSGHYCEVGSTLPYSLPCPIGKFNNLTGMNALADCQTCSPGMYCETQGLAWPTNYCDGGWFCTGGATSKQPPDPLTGGQCTVGNFCPNGSSAEISCTPGMYCDNVELSAPAGNCSAGHYCPLGSSSLSALPCPMGKFCIAGSSVGDDCPPGTFLNVTGGSDVSDCLPCYQGYYCAGYGNIMATAQCDAGVYCPSGMNLSSPAEYTCPEGHHCPIGSHEAIRCLSGTYQDETGKGTCKDCPAGYYCDNTMAPVVLYNNTICPEGYYCPLNTKYSSEFPCPSGTFGNITGFQQVGDCINCPGGYYCTMPAQTDYSQICNAGYFCKQGATSGTPSQGADADECPAGHFCPQQTAEPQKCPQGTFSNNTKLTAQSQCTNCTAGSYCADQNMMEPSGLCWGGYYCTEGADSPTYITCPEGAFCPNGSDTYSLCPQGTYSNVTHLTNSTECLPCPGGSYCETTGLTAPTGLCGEGYYCPEGTVDKEPPTTFCLVGHYCPEGVSQPIPCRNYTQVNHTHAVQCNACPAGFYCDLTGLSTICPAGYYCPAGTGIDWKSCPRGTYNDIEGISDESQCKPCPAGKYCDGEHLTTSTGDCAPGHWCVYGIDRQFPDGNNQSSSVWNISCYDDRQLGYGGICPVGNYCPGGTSSVYPIPCENGTYADTTGMAACTTCPAGYFCGEGTSNYTDTPCPAGHYCPAGTGYWNQYPCSAGTYNNLTIRTSVVDCLSCPGGEYCEQTGLTYPSGLCMAGYFCDSGSATATPSGIGGNNCSAGYFCPEGSTNPTPCTPGSYCGNDLLNMTSGLCDPGYYCTQMATVSNPTDGNVTGDICPTGTYCPAGSTAPLLCQAGTYLNSTGNDADTDCVSCVAGSYCSGSGNSVPDGLCSAGYYCPGGQDNPTPSSYNCTQGHYCPEGSVTPLRCSSGSYQDDIGQAWCKACPAGYFCDSTMDPVVLYNNSYCPTGFYCAENTTMSSEFPCPTGTFNNITHRTMVSDCTPCSGGMYCDQVGLTVPVGSCAAGYFCLSGANSSAPTQGSDADICPQGFYCPVGTVSPQSCPPGTYNPTTGRQSVDECTNCTGGAYCPDYNMTAQGPDCQAGYYCPTKADVAQFIQCPEGSYCPTGSDQPTPCAAGSFSNMTGLTAQSGCTNCTAGFYCPTSGMTETSLQCWGGYYCPEGMSVPNPGAYICPRGMHCPNGSEIYKECPDGSYTNYTGAASCDVCPAGFYCLPVQPANDTLNAQTCPNGYFCPAGTGINWMSCPSGSYSDQSGLYQVDQCKACTAGMYCQGEHLTAPTANCSAGYYCTSGVDRPQPGATNDSVAANCTCPDQAFYTGVGGMCPLGHYCPDGSATPTPCAAGTYGESTGLWECAQCLQGYYCLVNATEYLSTPCPAGHYCSNGTTYSTQYRCPPGTYNPNTLGTSLTDCRDCDAGQYCQGYANIAPTGNCSAGWYCTAGSDSPNTTTSGGICQPGYYCPEGSSSPTPCPGGKYCQFEGLDTPTGNCSAGYYCSAKASSLTPPGDSTGDVCPPGYYCEEGSLAPTPCNPGTYSPSTGNRAVNDCLACSFGEYCGDYNLTATTGNCSQGHYCPEGQTTDTLYQCTVGHYCPEATSSPILCPSGFYQDQVGQWTCKLCPQGYYCDNSLGVVVINETIKCPTGYYCPTGTVRSDQYPCPLGTYNNMTGLNQSSDCTPCSAGYHCSIVGQSEPVGLCAAGYFCQQYAELSTPNNTGFAGICPQGSYCPEGTFNPIDCPVGTYGGLEGLTNVTECTDCTGGQYCEIPGLTTPQGDCTAGYFCTGGSDSRVKELCTTGNFCPTGTQTPQRCPEGTFNPYLGLNSTEYCTPCTAGQYCETEGLNATTGPCEAGYYCPGGQNFSRPADYPCTVGNFCPINSSEPMPCANGTYMNHTMASECYTCPAGWYCRSGNLVDLCPIGHFCPAGTGFDWQQCPVGTYNNETGLTMSSECKPCPGGSYCDFMGMSTTTGLCDAGHYCEYGVDRRDPTGGNATTINGTCQVAGGETGVGGICPEGHYCPQGTTTPLPCGQGTFSNVSGLASCHQCPAGYYCVQGSVTYVDSPCPSGHYCPAGTYVSSQYPCPAQTYYNLTMARELSDCLSCPGGEYCNTDGLSAPTGLCSSGWYCTSNSSLAMPSAPEGGQCQAGFYCPTGSYEPQQCSPGKYCLTVGLDTPTGNCSQGYYCTLEASVATPTDNVTGAICPVGHYCEEMSSAPSPCPVGYYQDVLMQDEIADCKICIGGNYCPSPGAELPAGNCTAGFYCPVGQNSSTPDDYRCLVGHYCPEGSESAIRCENGTYQDQDSQSTCKQCPAGYFCDNTMGIVVLDNSTTICPMGYYCPAGTRYNNEFPCPIGTFNNRTGLSVVTDCTPCLGGYHCPMVGMVTPVDMCDAGHFCKQYANISAPDQGADANICPEGSYCLVGTSTPIPCPKGTYSNGTGLQAEADCTQCPAGWYCDQPGMLNVTGPCEAGYYCELSSNHSRRTICPAGSYCPEGSGWPSPCDLGTYSNTVGLVNSSQCTDCDPGSYCNDTGLITPTGSCDGGFYCPGRDTVQNPVATPCPVGLHCPIGSGLPVPCEPGTFANFTQASMCLTCPEGFYCVPEEVIQGNSTTGHRLCSRGFYCTAGTGRNESACPAGTYSNQLGLVMESECQQCTGGMYCDVTNLTAPVADCTAGYYCETGVDTPTPTGNHTGTGGICPIGYQCPQGTIVPQGCDAGSYQDESNQASCKSCPAGYYCIANSTTYSDKPCPSGHYCPAKTSYDTQFPCSAGTFNNLTGKSNSSACEPCTPGSYCGSPGMSSPTGLCDPGWYCTLGSSLAQTLTDGGKCVAGTYCPMGSSAPVGCDPGMYCNVDMMSLPAGNCSAGYYCDTNSTTSQPTGTGGNQCPSGHYCVEGSSAPEPCTPGYFQPSMGAQNSTWCLACTAGYYCNSSGLAVEDGMCDAGYYCPEGQVVRNPSAYECPVGYKCPTGSSIYQLCPAGFYQDEMRQDTCKECVEGFYCDNSVGPISNYTEYICPEGHYCPNGTKVANEFPCPTGTFNNQTGLRWDSECMACTGGLYCTAGTVVPSMPCAAGYYCRTAAQTAAPSQGSNADPCPVGHYCPEQTTEPIKCLPGTFSNNTKLMNVTDCNSCTIGSYCNDSGLIEPTGLCAPGFFCIEGSDNSSPQICTAGRYCPEGTHTPVRCPAGTFSNSTGLTASGECTNCTGGSYCTQTGLTDVEGNCTAGYYCPEGSSTHNAIICSIGLHCPEGSDQPLACEAGTFTNSTGMSSCNICPDGFYCVAQNVSAGIPESGYFNCPMGYYCPAGTGLNWQPCPKGTYSQQTNLYMVNQCKDCNGGYYCSEEAATNTTGLCQAGYYCQSGVDRANPDNAAVNSTYPPSCPLIGGHTGYGDICPLGYKCPEGSDAPIGCPAGEYQDETTQSTCKACPAGYYCLANSTDYTDKSCNSGYYCPENTTQKYANPCSAGTFNPATNQVNSSACVACTPGKYCQTTGLSAPTGNCSGGYYCSGGATSPSPTDPSMGGTCSLGQYCPEGSEAAIECTPGMYCQGIRLTEPTGNCSQGYYCNGSTAFSMPPDGATGGNCPTGYYCPEGSAYPTPCPIGYYRGSIRGTNPSSCTICTKGKHCDSEGLGAPAGDCAPGYYCPAGQTSVTPANFSCDPGYFCVGGKEAQEACPSGTYQDNPGQSECLTCPQGYYCNATFGPVVNYAATVCPEGYYCPNGTEHADQYPCPKGTFNNRTGLTNSSDCSPCTGRWACDQVGLTYPLQLCSAGYFCREGADSTTPNLVTADDCPAGSYCPEGTDEPIPCPEGTYSNAMNLHMESQCVNCTGGYHCNETGLTAPAGQCQERYYCPSGSRSVTEDLCPIGHFCGVGTEYPDQCTNGTFSDATGLAYNYECANCTSGYYCNGNGLTNVTGPCKAGYYCPSGSSVETQIICPAATHCPEGTGTPQYCPDGSFTDYDGAFVCDVCPEGYYCIPELVTPGVASTAKTLCPEGFFCPNGTGHNFQPCPAGTFNNVTGLQKAEDCMPCTEGKFCQGTNLTAPSGLCMGGYYCVSGVDRANPLMLNDTQCPTGTVHPIIGHECPAGHYCPEGSDNPIGCPAGSYQDLTNQINCKSCPEGHYCYANTSDYTPNVCPGGYYCGLNTTDPYMLPCPPGSYNNLTTQQTIGSCVPCTPGMYCQGDGNAYPTGNCSAGWYCTNGSYEAQPSSNGGECQVGFFCPEGSYAMQNCTPGKHCQTTGLPLPTNDCDAGYYCPGGATSAREIICPVGHYCPIGTDLPNACRNGTYASTAGLQSEGECTECDPGYYCNGTGLSATTAQCDAGYYCPGGQSVPDPSDYRCTPGHYCTVGTGTPYRCASGEYQNEYQQSTCKPCPAGYFCDSSVEAVGELTNSSCPQGFYCPAMTNLSSQFPCPAGTYNNRTGLTVEVDCQVCPPGKYCQATGLPEPEGDCFAGYYCNGSTTEPTPTEGRCPIGSYCPLGSYQPIPCPDGTIASIAGNTQLSDCEPCKPGNYCTPDSSRNGYSLPCDAGYICLNGSNVPTPTDGIIGYECPAGHYCQSGDVKETLCEVGTYAPSTKHAECRECPEGRTCPYQGMNYTDICPAGYFCGNGTSDNGQPCLIGSYSSLTGLINSWDCQGCPPGKFCNATGLGSPAGDCMAGYLCIENATQAAPNDALNKACPAGHYCLEGGVTAEPCPRGTFRNQSGGGVLADCWMCSGGYYCQNEALTTPTGLCAERYYCPESANISTATPTDYICPTGNYCPAGTADPEPCGVGTYQPLSGQLDCISCPSGFSCMVNTSTPEPCPAYSYCPNGTSDPFLCHNGTYTLATDTGLEKAEDCKECEAGKYCVGGRIAGDCSAGYLCLKGQSVPTPPDENRPSGGNCTYGFYCPAGTTSVQACPSLRFINWEGAASAAECDVCPGGFICPDNSTVSEPCPAGFYCEVSKAVAACPETTYNPVQGADDSSYCLPCPAGYFCNTTGMANYTVSPCPTGWYCTNATTAPQPCPPGTYRDAIAAGSDADCARCPAGFMCSNFSMSYGGDQCTTGYYCPEGSHNETICQAGYYCNRSMSQVPCPPGYYCPERSATPTPCPQGHYCEKLDDCNMTDAGAIEQIKCPLVYREKDAAPHESFADTCEACKPGTFGADPNRVVQASSV